MFDVPYSDNNPEYISMSTSYSLYSQTRKVSLAVTTFLSHGANDVYILRVSRAAMFMCTRQGESAQHLCSQQSHKKKIQQQIQATQSCTPAFFLSVHTPCTGWLGLSTIKLLKLTSYIHTEWLSLSFFASLQHEKLFANTNGHFFPLGAHAVGRIFAQSSSGRKQTREKENTLCYSIILLSSSELHWHTAAAQNSGCRWCKTPTPTSVSINPPGRQLRDYASLIFGGMHRASDLFPHRLKRDRSRTKCNEINTPSAWERSTGASRLHKKPALLLMQKFCQPLQ